MKNIMKNKAFTLIELLVVISIIGVLSSVIFVSFSGSRDKAKLAKAQNFDAQVSHALGAYAVGIWRFEDISGGKVFDESGYGNNGTIQGDPVLVDSEIYSGTKALEFDGSGDYVDCGSSSELLDIRDEVTIEFWMKTNVTGNRYPIVSNGRLCFWSYPGNRIQFGWYKDGSYSGRLTGTTTFSANKWTHIVAVVKNEGTGKRSQIYINGKFKRQSGIADGPMDAGAGPFVIGRSTLTEQFSGSIDNVSIYNEALSSAQIQQHFVAGAPSHGIAVYPVK